MQRSVGYVQREMHLSAMNDFMLISILNLVYTLTNLRLVYTHSNSLNLCDYRCVYVNNPQSVGAGGRP